MAVRWSCQKPRRRASPSSDSRKGSYATEFALLSGPFFLLMIGIVELCLIEAAQHLMESAAYNASRLAKTGYVTSGQTQAETVNAIITRQLSSYGYLMDPSKVVTTQESFSSFSSAGAGGGTTGYGTAAEIVAYSITYPWKVFTPLMCTAFASSCGEGRIMNITSTIVVRNEPYN